MGKSGCDQPSVSAMEFIQANFMLLALGLFFSFSFLIVNSTCQMCIERPLWRPNTTCPLEYVSKKVALFSHKGFRSTMV